MGKSDVAVMLDGLCGTGKQTEALCLAAVSKDGMALEYVENQTEEICLAAVRQNGKALQFVEAQTEAVCLAALWQNPQVLEIVKCPTREMELVAVCQEGWQLYNIDNPSLEVCRVAIHQDPFALGQLGDQLPELCLRAVKLNGMAIRNVRKQTPEVCLAAVRQDGRALRFVKEQTPKICSVAVQQNGIVLRYVKEQTPEISRLAVNQCYKAVKYVQDHVLRARLMQEFKIAPEDLEEKNTMKLVKVRGGFNSCYSIQMLCVRAKACAWDDIWERLVEAIFEIPLVVRFVGTGIGYRFDGIAPWEAAPQDVGGLFHEVVSFFEGMFHDWWYGNTEALNIKNLSGEEKAQTDFELGNLDELIQRLKESPFYLGKSK